MDPEILFFDEPSAGLDPIIAAGIDELILKLKKAFRITIVVVTHELASAFLIADRMIVLDKGVIVANGTTKELQASQQPRVRQFLDRVPEPELTGEIDYLQMLTGTFHQRANRAGQLLGSWPVSGQFRLTCYTPGHLTASPVGHSAGIIEGTDGSEARTGIRGSFCVGGRGLVDYQYFLFSTAASRKAISYHAHFQECWVWTGHRSLVMPAALYRTRQQSEVDPEDATRMEDRFFRESERAGKNR